MASTVYTYQMLLLAAQGSYFFSFNIYYWGIFAFIKQFKGEQQKRGITYNKGLQFSPLASVLHMRGSEIRLAIVNMCNVR